MKRSHIALAVTAVALAFLALVLLLRDPHGDAPVRGPDAGEVDHKPADPTAQPSNGIDSGGVAPEGPGPTWDEIAQELARTRGASRPAELAPGACKEDSHCSDADGLLRCDAAAGTCKEPEICVADEDCLGARVCQRGTCLDEIPGCRARDCFPGHCDHGFGECEYNPCKSDKDCAGTRHCNLELGGECQDCLADGDCADGKLCKQGQCQRSDHCVGDGECPGDVDVCDRVSGKCVSPACKPDSNEPNNKPDTATPLAAGSPVAGELCPDTDESDYYVLDVTKGEGFVVSVSSDRNHAFLEIRVFNRDKEDIGRSGDWEHQGYMEAVVPRAATDGPYYVRVKFTQGIPTPYVIQWIPVSDGFCHDDPFEPNDKLEAAVEVTDGRAWDMKLCGRDDDWFVHEIKSGQEVEVRVEQRESSPMPVIELFDDRELRRISRDDSGDPKKSLVFKGTHVGNFFVRVSQDDPDAHSDYAIHFVPR